MPPSLQQLLILLFKLDLLGDGMLYCAAPVQYEWETNEEAAIVHTLWITYGDELCQWMAVYDE
jgi:hypothetical protein